MAFIKIFKNIQEVIELRFLTEISTKVKKKHFLPFLPFSVYRSAQHNCLVTNWILHTTSLKFIYFLCETTKIVSIMLGYYLAVPGMLRYLYL
jgi:hypothetical protein